MEQDGGVRGKLRIREDERLGKEWRVRGEELHTMKENMENKWRARGEN